MPLSSELTLASSPRAAADARRWVGDVCLRLDRPDLVECAELGVSELVANAILHAAAPYKVRVRGTASHPRIEVVDGSTRPPVPPTPVEVDDLDLLLTFGRGLSMVSQCAVAWGATIESDGKIVWFEPAPQMSDDGAAEWVIDQLDSTDPELVAEGAVDVSCEPEVSLWDLAPLQVIVEEAGGRFTDLSGAARPDGGSVVCTNGALHDDVLALLQG